jgi:hypothetical protein
MALDPVKTRYPVGSGTPRAAPSSMPKPRPSLSPVQNRKFGPYLMTVNRILISLIRVL